MGITAVFFLVEIIKNGYICCGVNCNVVWMSQTAKISPQMLNPIIKKLESGKISKRKKALLFAFFEYVLSSDEEKEPGMETPKYGGEAAVETPKYGGEAVVVSLTKLP